MHDILFICNKYFEQNQVDYQKPSTQEQSGWKIIKMLNEIRAFYEIVPSIVFMFNCHTSEIANKNKEAERFFESNAHIIEFLDSIKLVANELANSSKNNTLIKYKHHTFLLKFALVGESKNIMIVLHDVSIIDENSKDKFRMLYMTSTTHTLRSPLNSIINSLECLEGYNLKPIDSECLKAGKSAAQLLDLYIENSITLTQIENDTFIVNPKPMSIIELISECKQIYDLEISQKALMFNIDCDAPNFIMSDRKRLKQVLTILIGNSVKFTFHGSISVHITTNVEKTMIKIGVIDTGHGIKADQLALIFDPFTMADYKNVNMQTGIGMNLYMCKKIMEKLNGNITASSKYESGSMFVIRLPLKIIVPYTQSASDISPHKIGIPTSVISTKESVSVLIVDDSKFNSTVLQKLLMDFNFTFDFALNGKEACEKVDSRDYFMIFMDINMPIMNGIEAASEIRRKEKRRNIILAVTAQDGIVQNSLFDRVLLKPVKRDELKRVISEYILNS